MLVFVQCTHCLYFSVLAVVFQTFNWQCVLDKSEYINGTVNCIKVEATDFAVDFEMLHFPSYCD